MTVRLVHLIVVFVALIAGLFTGYEAGRRAGMKRARFYKDLAEGKYD